MVGTAAPTLGDDFLADAFANPCGENAIHHRIREVRRAGTATFDRRIVW
jgi:hypothetical protein